MSIPGLDAFLHAPIDQVAAVAPHTLLYAPGGTRRSAVLAGIAPDSDAYAAWARQRTTASAALLFRCGVRHLFMNVLRPAQLAEVGRYRERVLTWLAEGLAGDAALAEYAQYGWRVRLVGAEGLPELQAAAARLATTTPAYAERTLWWYVSATPDAHWAAILEAAHRTGARTQAEAIRALYGEDVPLATMCLSFGKPMIAADILPLIMAGEVHCYWSQHPGFLLDEQVVRQIWYDYAYLRSTWVADKSTRYHDVITHRGIWEQQRVLGMGQRIGGFWYPV